MRAAVVRRASGTFAVEALRRPSPGPGEILVRVAACGVCHTDLHVHGGAVPFPFPCVLGHEISGTVAHIGEGVEDLAPGDRVVGAFIMPCGKCAQCTIGREELCEPFFAHNRQRGTLYDGSTRLFDADGDPVWMYSMGGLSEYAVLPARGAARLADKLPLADSCVLGCALLTAYGATHTVGALHAGETVAVIGAGGVGNAIAQVARATGASQVVAVDIGEDKLEAARRCGATHTVDASALDAVTVVRELTDGRGADVVFEAVGHPTTFRQATEMAADGGRCVMVGIASAGRLGEVEITRLVRRKLQILGSFGGRPRASLPQLMEMVADGRIALDGLISRRYTLEEADEAYRALAAGRIIGRAIVEMGADA